MAFSGKASLDGDAAQRARALIRDTTPQSEPWERAGAKFAVLKWAARNPTGWRDAPSVCAALGLDPTMPQTRSQDVKS